MKAITTKYLSATATRPARIKAFDMDGNSITIPAFSRSHKVAAYALCDKMGWKGELIGGTTKEGMVWVFVE